MRLRIFNLILAFFFSYVQVLAQGKHYFQQTEIGLSFGRSQELWDGSHEDRLDFTFQTFHGARISKNHVLGFSAGFDQYEDISLLPFAFGYRGFLGKENKPQLFAGLDLGGSSAILEKKEKTEWQESWYEGGYLISPLAGVKLPAKNGKSALSFTFAYKRQGVSKLDASLIQPGTNSLPSSLLPPEYNSLNETETIFHSFVFRMGLMF